MTMKSYIQGKSAHKDKELFGLVGHWLVDQIIHEKLGTAITTQPGDLWFISTSHKGEAKGFATGRLMKNGGLHIRFVYCHNCTALSYKTFIKAFLNLAEQEEARRIYTNDKPDNPHWPEFGFTFTPRARGVYGRWEKQLEKKNAK